MTKKPETQNEKIAELLYNNNVPQGIVTASIKDAWQSKKIKKIFKKFGNVKKKVYFCISFF